MEASRSGITESASFRLISYASSLSDIRCFYVEFALEIIILIGILINNECTNYYEEFWESRRI